MHKIIIVDDHSLFREGIKLLIENEGFGEVIAEAENGLIFLELLKIHKPDLVIMDIEMPVMNGLEATINAIKIYPEIKIIALTMLNEKANYLDMINAGALGFVLKTSGKQEFENAIKSVMNGESYFSNEILRQIILNSNAQSNTKKNSIESHIPELTSREREVLICFCEGQTVSEIAVKLFLSPKTIEVHRSTLLKKTNTRNTINLILYALKNKIVEI